MTSGTTLDSGALIALDRSEGDSGRRRCPRRDLRS
jgi:hypothetical protein